MNADGTYESRAAAYNGAVDMLSAAQRHGVKLDGAFVCQDSRKRLIVWPMGGVMPKSYRVLDEVFLTA